MSRAAPRAPQAPSRVARRGVRARRGSSSRAHPSRRAFAAAAAAAEAKLATPEANLLAWARADGLWLSDKVVVGAPAAGAPRGLIATSAIAEGEDVILLPNECTAFDASYATARGSGDVLAAALADAVDAYASAPRRGGDVTDEIALALFVALAARHPDRTPFGAYVEALPREIPASPIFFPDSLLRDLLPALPLAFVDDVDAARLELDATWDVAAAVMDHVAPAEPELGVDEFARAWMAIRSRAIAFSVARRPSSSAAASSFSASSSPSSPPPVAAAAAAAASRRCAVPVVDLMNHACEAAPGDPSSVASYPGPAVRIETRDGAVAWVATRRVEKGEDVRWSYGAETSNETLWLWYGFVPDPPTHRGATATVQIPETTLRGALDAVAKDDDAGRRAARVNLLVRAGAFSSRRSPRRTRAESSSRSSPAAAARAGVDEPEAFGTEEDGSERALRFDLRVGESPVALAGVAGLMCCSPEEAETIDAVLAASFGGCVMDGFDEEEEEEEGEEGSGSVARVDDAGRVKVRLAPESRRRAGKYVAFVLDQLEGIACGEDVGGDEGGGGGGGGDAAAGGARRREDAFASARRLREGARAAFAHARANLDDETLLREGEWIDEAVARALAPY